VVFLSFSIMFDGRPDTDRLVAIVQSHLRDDGSLDGVTIESNETRYTSCRSFATHCADQLKLGSDPDSTAFWIAEMRTGQAREMFTPVTHDVARRTYGLLTADEGWCFVPECRVDEIMTRNWSSRDFLWVGAFSTGVVVYNDKNSDYGDAISKFYSDWFATDRPYYSDMFHVAGLDHGPLYALEAAIVLKLTAEQLIRDIEDLVGSQSKNGLSTVKVSWLEFLRPHVGSMQLRVFKYLDHVRHVGIGELSSLDALIANELGLTSTIKDVARFGEMIDSQSTNLTTMRLNGIVIVLTIVTVLIAAVALVKGFT